MGMAGYEEELDCPAVSPLSDHSATLLLSPGLKNAFLISYDTPFLSRDARVSESGKSAINNLVLHPNGVRLLVHVRDSCLKILDIETFLILHSFNGLSNDK
jgi:hypothetical protein